MKAAVISQGSKSSLWTIDAMKNYFDEVDNIDITQIQVNLGEAKDEYVVLYKGEPLPKYDCIYAKGSFKFKDLLRSVTSSLIKDTYMPIVPSAFTEGHDKLLTHLKLQAAKVPMPKTYMCATIDASKALLKMINFPIIMKFPEGTHGKGVMFADSYESASTILDALSALGQPFLIQEYVETGGEDIRAIVVGNRVVASMKRKASGTEKRANIHSGGTGEAVQLDSHTQKIAVETAKALGVDICAVDILLSPKGPMVIELNLSPGLQGITKYTGTDVASKIAKFLYETTKQKTKKEEKATSDILHDLGIESTGAKQIISNLDFRGERILLPKMISKQTKFSEKTEVIIKAEEGKLVIEKFNIG